MTAPPEKPMPPLVGGISSAGRSLPELDGVKFRTARAKGPYLWDEDGRRYIDLVQGFGAAMLGHSAEAVNAAVSEAVAAGALPGFAHGAEERAAAALTRRTGKLTRAIFVNSGSEAVQLACQTARARTGRRLIAKFAGAYHGWHDGPALGRPGSPEAKLDDEERKVQGQFTLLRFNDTDDIERLFSGRHDIAAILIEPVLANAGCIRPAPSYLKSLAQAARRHGALLIADEVLMGFRVHNGLFSHQCGLSPELAAVGKAIGSGVAVAALIGTDEIMADEDGGRPLRAGTYSGNPVASAAVSATMAGLENIDYRRVLARGDRLRARLSAAAANAGLTLCTSGFGSVFTIWFRETPPGSYAAALAARRPELSMQLHLRLRRRGVLTMPDGFGRCFITAAHDDEVLEETASIFEQVLAEMADIAG